MKKWEYLHRSTSDLKQAYKENEVQNASEYLNKYAEQGWELFLMSATFEHTAWCFRRELPEPLTMAPVTPITPC